jgi:CRP/FNR family transcriptional regulator
MTNYVHGIATLSVQGRLASVFLHFAEQQGNELNLPISQGNLASLVGSSRGHVNQALAKMQAQELIRLEGQKIHILDRQGLEKISEV